MKTVIGLYSSYEDAAEALQALAVSNVAIQQASLVNSEGNVLEILHGHQRRVLGKFAGYGLLLGVLLFVLYNLAGLFCECGLMVFDFWVELDTLLLFVAFSAVVGLGIAYFVRVERLNGSLRPYLYNVRHGSVIAVVHTTGSHEAQVIDILYRHHGTAIRTLENRLHSLRHPQPHHYI
ncbi:MAG: hypothetical protein Kow0031_20360 [Anaerolineae bacterium]